MDCPVKSVRSNGIHRNTSVLSVVKSSPDTMLQRRGGRVDDGGGLEILGQVSHKVFYVQIRTFVLVCKKPF